MLEQWSNIGRHHGKISRSAKEDAANFAERQRRQTVGQIKKMEVFFGGGRSEGRSG